MLFSGVTLHSMLQVFSNTHINMHGHSATALVAPSPLHMPHTRPACASHSNKQLT